MSRVLAVLLAVGVACFAGCHYSKIQVIQTETPASQQHQSLGAFNDETYVWESWWFGTNKVDKLDALDK